jgi:hypothetical protein
MLTSPGQRDRAAFDQRVEALGEEPRFWRLNAYEALWKGTRWDDRPSFWDPEVPLNERAPAVCGSDAEAMGRVLVRFCFGTARFPALAVGESEYGLELSDEYRAALEAGAKEVVRQARLRLVMRRLLEQGLMLGSACAVLSIERGRCVARVFSAKHCTPSYESGELVSLEISYLTQRDGKHVRYRRLIERDRDVTFHEREADPERGLLGDEWVPDPVRTIEHNLGFVPAVWHRHNPDPSDCDAIDGTPLMAGLEDELFAIDMALSQHHRNGRYNGEPQMLLSGVDEAPVGEQGREAKAAGVFSWLGGRAGSPATKKAPGKLWKVPAGGDAKMVESTGAGAAVLREDAAQLKRAVRESRGIVIAAPETVSANASAALMKALYEPTIAEVDNLREEYGPLLTDIVNLFFRLLASPAVRAGGAFVRGLAALAPALALLSAPAGEGGSRWVGAPLECQWGEYFEPTWQDVTQAITAARSGLEGGVLTRRQAVQLVARVAHSDDVERTVADIEREQGVASAAAERVLGAMNSRAPMGSGPAPELSYEG